MRVLCSVQITACEKFTSDLGLGDGFRRVLQFPPPLITTMYLVTNWPNNVRKSDDNQNAKFGKNPSRLCAMFYHTINSPTTMTQYDRKWRKTTKNPTRASNSMIFSLLSFSRVGITKRCYKTSEGDRHLL